MIKKMMMFFLCSFLEENMGVVQSVCICWNHHPFHKKKYASETFHSKHKFLLDYKPDKLLKTLQTGWGPGLLDRCFNHPPEALMQNRCELQRDTIHVATWKRRKSVLWSCPIIGLCYTQLVGTQLMVIQKSGEANQF